MLTATIDAHNHGSKHAASRDSRRAGRFQQPYLRHVQRPKIVELQHTRSKSASGLFVPMRRPPERGNAEPSSSRPRPTTTGYSTSPRRRSSRRNVWDRFALDVKARSDGHVGQPLCSR
jgi:hypothetical protein